MNYQQAISYLQELTRFGINPGLGRMNGLLLKLGNPQKKIKVVHVGGTNGKGSAIAILQSVMRQAGYSVGVFTSPHLYSYRERFVLNGEPISEQQLAEIITDLREPIRQMLDEGREQPTEFEVLTAAAFLWFARQQPDIVLLEVGMGGAIDSTNVVIPEVAVITNVSIDHTAYLGKTIPEIAAVKAGIAKRGIPLVTTADDDAAVEVIKETCRRIGAPSYCLNRNFAVQQYPEDTAVTAADIKALAVNMRFKYQGIYQTYSGLRLSLQGQHQILNAAAALAVIELLQQNGWLITEQAMRDGLWQASWPGRLEWISHKPAVLIDAAHNYAGAVSLRCYLRQILFPNGLSEKQRHLILVFGMLDDKERDKVAAELLPLADQVIITRPAGPRAQHWQELQSLAEKRYKLPAQAIADVGQAVAAALQAAGENSIICITGSIYMIGEARQLMISQKNGG